MNMLIAEDSHFWQRFYQAFFREEGIHANILGNGDEALGHYLQHRSQIMGVILDGSIETKNSFWLAHAIREYDVTIPIILSSYEFETYSEGSGGVYFTHLLRKPFLRTELKKIVYESCLKSSVRKGFQSTCSPMKSSLLN